MVVTTESGNRYFFAVKDNALHFVKGVNEGIVSSIKGLEIGEQLEIHFYPLDPVTYEKSDTLSYALSSKVVAIE